MFRTPVRSCSYYRLQAGKREEIVSDLNRGAGVDVDGIDDFGAMAREHANASKVPTARLFRYGGRFLKWTDGESCAIIKIGGLYIGLNVEGEGTGSIATDGTRKLDKVKHAKLHATDGISASAMSLNDLITLGVMPLLYQPHIGFGGAQWLKDRDRSIAILEGLLHAALTTGTIWAGGETAQLSNLVVQNRVALEGGSVGIVPPRHKPLNPKHIKPGDRVLLFRSNGVHSNGLSAIRKIADKIGYDHQLSDGSLFGEAVRKPTTLYVELMECLMLDPKVELKYGINITGSGWRKLMRAPQPWGYRMNGDIPDPQPEFTVIQEHHPDGLDLEDMYANYNMGAGFAVIVSAESVRRVMKLARKLDVPIEVYDAGEVHFPNEAGNKYVSIRYHNILFEGETLGVR